MKKTIFALVLVGVALGTWWRLSDSAAFTAYQTFADAIVLGQFDKCASVADPVVLKRLQESEPKRNYRPFPMEAGHGYQYEVEEESRSDDGVRLQVVQTVRFDPPGAHSGLGGSMYSKFRHHVVMTSDDSGWRVKQFKSEHLETDDVPRR